MGKRLQTNVSDSTNDWLEVKSKEMGISKSALIAVAVETYKQQLMSIEVMSNFDKYQSMIVNEITGEIEKLFENYDNHLEEKFNIEVKNYEKKFSTN